MHKLLFTIIFYCCCMPGIHAQRFEYKDSTLLESHKSEFEQEEEKDILSDTTVHINYIALSPDSVRAWKSNKRFAYMKNIDSLLKKKNQEEIDENNKALQQKPSRFFQMLFSSNILQVIFWTIAIAFVVFILYKLFLSNGIFRKSSASVPVNEVPVEELIKTAADYDKLLHQSIKLGDHRMAVRYLFLKTLALLSDKEYVHYSADKTNYQYVQEIRADKKNDFASLVLNYEYVWYGNFPIKADTYTGIEKKFTAFNSTIQ